MKKNLEKFFVMLMIMTLAFGLTACGANNSANSSDDSSSAVESTEGSSEETTEDATAQITVDDDSVLPETTYPITITDEDGNTITIEEEPQTIVSVAPNMTELIYALCQEDKLVGRTDYCDYPEAALSVESIGTITSPDIERIVELDPDLVLTSTHFTDENTEKLEELGIQQLTLYSEDDMDGVYDMITLVGLVLNNQAGAEELVSNMKTTIAGVEDAVAGLEAPSVYYVVSYGDGGDYTAGGDTFINGLITAAGGDNIAADVSGWTYSLESLIEQDPEIIIVGEGESEDFCANESYANLTAVKEGNVYEIDKNLLDRQGYRNSDGVLALAKIFHPEAFED